MSKSTKTKRPPKEPNSAVIYVRCPESMKEAIQREASILDLSETQMARRAMQFYLDREATP